MKTSTLLSISLSLIAPLATLGTAHAEESKAPEAAAAAKLELAKLFEGKLTDGEGKSVSADNLKEAKFVAVYFSAHWCPPCRAFTPELVKFVAENRKDGNFEVVFVSSDRDKKSMTDYISGAKMSWGGVLGRELPKSDLGAGINGIPHLRVFDAEGNIVIDSVKDGQYVGPRYVLAELKKKI